MCLWPESVDLGQLLDAQCNYLYTGEYEAVEVREGPDG